MSWLETVALADSLRQVAENGSYLPAGRMFVTPRLSSPSSLYSHIFARGEIRGNDTTTLWLVIEEDEHLQNEAKELAQLMSVLNRLRKN